MFFDYIKQYYTMGLYTKDDLKTLKLGGMMTADQYDELVGAAKTEE
ncbi:XkdX family protein [Lactiplantibacillus plajomi]|uniref:XkdX family protein n=1 Tax=Lactiplantibacillus plajomi TaxID=1457217 RepID=A0ABV6K1N4_9LACO|nr:XkdX family protein [Lactiplantibacillus plajomi]